VAVSVRAHWFFAVCMLVVGSLAFKYASMRLKHDNHPTFDDLVASHMLGGHVTLEEAVRRASSSQAIAAALGAAITIISSAIVCLGTYSFRHPHTRLDDVLSYVAYACILIVVAVSGPILRHLSS